MSKLRERTSQQSFVMILAGISLLGILAFCAYWPSLHAPFVFDDQFAILENHSIEHMADLRLVLSPPAEAAGAAGRPLVNLTLAINYAIGHYNVFGYHLFNVCLHILTSVVLFLILLRALKLDSSYWFSLSVVSIWALHPLLTESVSCVIQRDEILGAFFILLTLYAFIKSIDSCSEQHAKLWKSVSLLACSVGIGAKETIICAPLIVFLYDSFYVTGSFLGSLKIRKGYYTVLCATWIPLFYLIFNSNKRGGTVGFGLGVSTWSYLLTQTKALCIYIKLVLWPRPLIIDYGTQLVRGINEIPLQAIFISGVLIVTLYGLIRKQSYAFLGAVFFILLAPSSSFVPLVSQPIAEHRMYLPSIVVLVSLSLIIVITLPSKFIPVLSSVLISILLILTYLRNNDYQNELNLINQCISYNPLNDRAYLNRGTLLSRDGKIDEAIQDYETALKLNTKSADTHFNLALLHEQKGDLVSAKNHLIEAIVIKPNYPVASYELGLVYFKDRDYNSAIVHLKFALKLQPTIQKTRKLLSQCYSLIGDQQAQNQEFIAALDSYEAALNLDIGNSRLHCNLGNVFSVLGKKSEAVNEYQEAIRYDSLNVNAHYNLAQELMDQGKYNEAQSELAIVRKLNQVHP